MYKTAGCLICEDLAKSSSVAGTSGGPGPSFAGIHWGISGLLEGAVGGGRGSGGGGDEGVGSRRRRRRRCVWRGGRSWRGGAGAIRPPNTGSGESPPPSPPCPG